MATNRRTFLLQSAAMSGAAAAQTPAGAKPDNAAAAAPAPQRAEAMTYPRTFRGKQLAMIAFPLGGVGAGSVALGGRGQLRDWEIFNRPDKGNALSYALPSIWAQAGDAKPVARVLEARLLPPYEGSSGLGSQNAPGLTRLAGATFTGEFPFARVAFSDRTFPVRAQLEAFTPFIPHEPDDSGLPATVLRYRITNPGRSAARVSIAWSIENPVMSRPANTGDRRVNEHRKSGELEGLYMTNPGLTDDDPMQGSFAVAAVVSGGAKLSWLSGWPRGRWWNSPMLFWDDFSSDGSLGPEEGPRSAVGALCLERTVAPGASEDFTFILAWRFPNRTPERCGWRAPKGEEKTVIGNWYAKRFGSAWEAAEYLASNLPRLEAKSRAFVAAVRESAVPAPVKDAAMANLSTLVSTTCFRTADGEFHGFEGSNDHAGCCYGNCTHVWNYETTTTHLFPTFARSLRKSAFGFSMDDAGAMHFRQSLPDGYRSGFAATDGQMGQLLHAYIDWQLCGDTEWLRGLWPRIKKGIEFAWVKGGWDSDKDGVTEGVQHNTYDVEFYGPNPECSIYYLGGLRACEEMARAVGDTAAAAEYRRLFEQGSKWIDANLFNGEYYIQKVRGFAKDEVAPSLRSDMGADDTQKPEYQLGEGCLADQLIGQYLADVAGLGPLLEPAKMRSALRSVMKYNNRRNLENHDSVQRTYALNDEAALLICDYGKAERPRIPFPYYAEAWTGIEYMVGAQMMYRDMAAEGIQLFQDARMRHDGERRNPWNEPECGHHYARAMSAWSGMAALSGLLYRGADGAVVLTPRWGAGSGRCFWATGTGWGTYARSGAQTTIEVLHGSLPCQSCDLAAAAIRAVSLDGKAVKFETAKNGSRVVARLSRRVDVAAGSKLQIVTGS
jgi:uncharacterized protein (DUF608 family)